MAFFSHGNNDPKDASNAFHSPSLLAQTQKTLYSFNLSHLSFHLNKFDSIVLESAVNSDLSSPSTRSGEYEPEVPNLYLLSAHVSSSFLFKTKFNLSMHIPIGGQIAEFRTTDPYLPEYPLLHRYERPMFETSLAKKFSSFNLSLGLLFGFQSKGESFLFAKENGSQIYSNAELSQNLSPSASFNFSFYKKFKHFDLAVKFQDEMTTKLETSIDAYLVNGATIPVSWNMTSLLYYDPRSLSLNFYKNKLGFSLKYEWWDHFKSPIIELENTGGILTGSDNEKNFTTKNTLTPSVSYLFKGRKASLGLGLSHKPSPLKLYDDKNGNVLDNDRSSLGISYLRPLSILGEQLQLSISTQFHYLHPIKVDKSGPSENNQTSFSKIGAGGYEAKGHILATSFGLNWVH